MNKLLATLSFLILLLISSVTVRGATTTVAWDRATNNVDGSVLVVGTNAEDLAGTKLYYGYSSGVYDGWTNITPGNIETGVINNLIAASETWAFPSNRVVAYSPSTITLTWSTNILNMNTWYFSAKHYNNLGWESDYSSEATKTNNLLYGYSLKWGDSDTSITNNVPSVFLTNSYSFARNTYPSKKYLYFDVYSQNGSKHPMSPIRVTNAKPKPPTWK